MEKSKKALILLIPFLLIFGIIYQQPVKGQAQSNVTISADGSVYPSTAPIQRIGSLYLVMADTGQISINSSNIILDGGGHTIRGQKQVGLVDNIGGISVDNGENVTIRGFIIKDCGFGIALSFCSNITVSNNTITGTYATLLPDMPYGIFLWQSNNIKISENILDSNDYGLYLGLSQNNIATNNVLSNNRYAGIIFDEASNNNFFHNNFENTRNYYDRSLDNRGISYRSTNTWDNGKEGNYWNDYNGTDSNSDGIGDTPYSINLQNVDSYPLIRPYEIQPMPTPTPTVPELPSLTVLTFLLASLFAMGVFVTRRKVSHQNKSNTGFFIKF